MKIKQGGVVMRVLKEREKISMVVHESIRVSWKVNLPLNLTISSKGRVGRANPIVIPLFFQGRKKLSRFLPILNPHNPYNTFFNH